ncbi:MAG: radical SAM protein [Sphingobacterium mizutaii]|nr:radical SAM protein [Sphingobacterium mizutaii]
MKASKYNMFFDYENQKIGFNSYSREYMALDDSLYLMYDSSVKNSEFESLQSMHPTFFDFLVEKGFLVENAEDELQKVKDLVSLIDNDESVFQLHINPTMNCNFKCWYCYETHIKDSKMDISTIDSTVRFVKGILTSRKDTLKFFSLDWFGGEPLLYFKRVVLPILKEVHALCTSLGIEMASGVTTNGLLINSEVIQAAKLFNLSFFQITLDGHRDRHDVVRFMSEGRGSYDAIIKNIKLLAANSIKVLIRINCSPETLPDLKKISEDFRDLTVEAREFIEFDLHKVWQDNYNVSDEDLYDIRWYYREQGFKVATGSHDLVMNSCYGDHKNHATINYNGEVFKCTARDFTSTNSEGYLSDSGEVIWNDKYTKRLESKFKNKPCLDCVILPICNGGCSQQALEHEGVDYCVNDFDENKKRMLVINRFKESLLEN